MFDTGSNSIHAYMRDAGFIDDAWCRILLWRFGSPQECSQHHVYVIRDYWCPLQSFGF